MVVVVLPDVPGEADEAVAEGAEGTLFGREEIYPSQTSGVYLHFFFDLSSILDIQLFVFTFVIFLLIRLEKDVVISLWSYLFIHIKQV